ncbi:ABC transporter ATP-binding protein [bacterium]|nr:ABC transporter ATP-binding protein [bacterium]
MRGNAKLSGTKTPQKINFKSLIDTIKLMWKGNEIRTILVLTFTLLSALAGAIAMSFTQRLYDEVVPLFESHDENAMSALISLVTVWGSFLAVELILIVIRGQIIVKLGQNTLRKVRNAMFNNMEYLPIRFFDQNKYGDIMSRYTNDVDTLDNFITQTIPNLISVVTSVFALFIMMLINNWLLTIITIVILGLIMLLSTQLLKRSTKHFILRQKLLGRLNGYVEEMMEGTRVVQVFNHQDTAMSEFETIIEEYRQEELKGNMIGNVIAPLNGNLIRIEYVIITIIGAAFVLNGNYTIGLLITFLTFLNNFANPIARFAQQLTSVAQASAGSMRIIDLMTQEHEVDDGYVTLVNYNKDANGNIIETDENNHNWAWKHPHEDGTLTYTPLCGEIVLKDVDFSYVKEKQILYDINIYAKPGQKIALVGETGAGKTTITNLINRFYDIEDGKIRYDGININKIKKSDLRKSLGLVLQETNLFTGTIKDNIKLGKEDATDEEVIEAAKVANADSFIRMMPNGYDTILVRAGENLSQGQRQLIAIARAAIADFPVLILDEATSSIDTRTEQIVQKGMDKLMENRTVFVIAHRLSTIQSANAIMVMRHGRIIERGEHKSLIELKGMYYQLYTGKFELE